MKKDIDRFENDNLGGINSFKIIEAKHIIGWPPVYAGCIHTAPIIAPGAAWRTIYCTEGTMQLKDDQQPSDHGAYHTKEFSGNTPKDRPEVLELLNHLKDEKFVLDCLDNNGQRKLVGTPSEPLTLVSSADTKNSVPGRNEYKLVFKGDGINKSPFYKL